MKQICELSRATGGTRKPVSAATSGSEGAAGGGPSRVQRAGTDDGTDRDPRVASATSVGGGQIPPLKTGRTYIWMGVLALTVTASCTNKDRPRDREISAPLDSSYIGRLATVQVTEAIIGPGKSGGTQWDGVGQVSPILLSSLDRALVGPDPVGDVLTALSRHSASLGKPDPYGTVQLTAFGIVTDRVPLATVEDAIPDTFVPSWPYRWRYTNVPIDSDVRITVDLLDRDLMSDDAIGVAEIVPSDLVQALRSRGTFQVQVDGQTEGQLLFVGIDAAEQK